MHFHQKSFSIRNTFTKIHPLKVTPSIGYLQAKHMHQSSSRNQNITQCPESLKNKQTTTQQFHIFRSNRIYVCTAYDTFYSANVVSLSVSHRRRVAARTCTYMVVRWATELLWNKLTTMFQLCNLTGNDVKKSVVKLRGHFLLESFIWRK